MAGDWAAEINGDEDEDEALRIAIALSMGQTPARRPGGPKDVGTIDLTQDEDDDRDGDRDDTDATSKNVIAPVGPNAEKPSASENPPPPSSSFAVLGIDRKKMEEERLARLGKRKASELGDVREARPVQRPRTANAQPSPPSESGHVGKGKREELGSAASAKPPGSDLPFPRGVVKKTWAFGHPRQADDIKIEEVLQKHKLQLAVLSSYQWDEEWLLSKIDLARTKLVLIAFATDEAQKEEMRSNVPRDRIRFCFPPMQAMGSMHSKLQLLKYETYMRIVIPTGNLMSYDWGETGTMENMVFIIDLPKFHDAAQRDAQQLTPFGEELSYFLRAQGLDEKLVSSLDNYDFSQTSRYSFVHTIPGSHTGEDAWRRTGYCGLGRAVSALGLSSASPIELDFVCASLGAVNYSLLAALYYACQGDCGLKEYESRTCGRKSKNAASADNDIAVVRDHTRVYFPSRETVLQSKGGRNGAGTICFQAKWWRLQSFPHEVLRDCKSVRKGLLMHSKVIYVRRRDTEKPNSCRGFAYVGSANLSESAWGRLVKDRVTGKPKLTCRNWECGVLLQASDSVASAGASNDLDMFKSCVPVPMEWPGLAFSSGAGDSGHQRTPWFYQDG
ncbi:hypothetical protein VTK56DRAFT_5693 [Thermocarpiscus australiensis]